MVYGIDRESNATENGIGVFTEKVITCFTMIAGISVSDITHEFPRDGVDFKGGRGYGTNGLAMGANPGTFSVIQGGCRRLAKLLENR